MKFSSFFTIPEHDLAYGCYYQISVYFKKKRMGFDPSGTFTGEISNRKDFTDLIIKEKGNIPYLREMPERIGDFIENNDIADAVFSLLTDHPLLFAVPGRLAFWLFTDIPENAGAMGIRTENDIASMDRYLKTQFCPDKVRYENEGSNNLIYRLDLPVENKTIPLCIRIFKDKRKKGVRPYAGQIEMHCLLRELHESFGDNNGVLKIPPAYFAGGFGAYMVMEFIENAHPLETGVDALSAGDITKLREMLDATLALWRGDEKSGYRFVHRDFHGGNVIITTDENNRLASAYAIDFDFSVYKPEGITENEIFSDVIAGTKYTYGRDTQIYAYL